MPGVKEILQDIESQINADMDKQNEKEQEAMAELAKQAIEESEDESAWSQSEPTTPAPVPAPAEKQTPQGASPGFRTRTTMRRSAAENAPAVASAIRTRASRREAGTSPPKAQNQGEGASEPKPAESASANAERIIGSHGHQQQQIIRAMLSLFDPAVAATRAPAPDRLYASSLTMSNPYRVSDDVMSYMIRATPPLSEKMSAEIRTWTQNLWSNLVDPPGELQLCHMLKALRMHPVPGKIALYLHVADTNLSLARVMEKFDQVRVPESAHAELEEIIRRPSLTHSVIGLGLMDLEQILRAQLDLYAAQTESFTYHATQSMNMLQSIGQDLEMAAGNLDTKISNLVKILQKSGFGSDTGMGGLIGGVNNSAQEALDSRSVRSAASTKRQDPTGKKAKSSKLQMAD